MKANGKRLTSAAVITLVYALAVTVLFQYMYFVNDDLIIRDILSGRFSGVADAHIYNVIYPFAWLVKLAYQIFPELDIWAFLMVGLIYICLFAVVYRTLGLVTKRCLLTIGCVLGLFTCAVLHHICFFTFTATGTICAATALFLYVTTPPDKTKVGTYLPSLLLMLVSFCIRKDTLLMVLPFFGVWLVYLFLKEQEKRKNLLKLLRPVFALAVCCAVLWVGHLQAFSGEEWQDFLEFRDLRKSVHDFSGYPSYEENKGLYEDIGISYEEYRTVATGNLGGGNTVLDYSEDIRSILAQVAEQNRTDPTMLNRANGLSRINEMLYFSIKAGKSNLMFGLLLTLVLTAVLACRKRWKLLAALYIGVAGVFLEIGLIAWGGHISRVVIMLLTSMMIIWPCCVAAYFLGIAEKPDAALEAFTQKDLPSVGLCIADITKFKKWAASVCFGTLCVCIAAGCLTAGSWVSQIKGEESAYALRSDATYELYNYCRSDPENTYFQPALAITYHTDTLSRFRKFDSSFNNLVILGGWNAFSPEYQQSLVTMGLRYETIEAAIVNQENVRVISDETYIANILEYFQWKYGDRLSWEITDTIETDGLGTLEVYDFELLPEE